MRLMHGDDMNAQNMLNNKKDDDECQTEIQLYKIKPQEHFIEAQVREGDTLQAIALRFYCSISELKRINHIHKDNEIFARRTIKVPVTPYSVLTELIPVQPPEPTPSTSSQTLNSLQELLQNNEVSEPDEIISTPEQTERSVDYNAVVMNSTLAPSVIPYTDVEPAEPITEGTQLLPNNPKVSVEAVVVKELTSHGADFGLKWFHLVCFMMILGVVVPLVYIMFYLDKPEHPELADQLAKHSTR